MSELFGKVFRERVENKNLSLSTKVLADFLYLEWIESGRAESVRIRFEEIKVRLGFSGTTIAKALRELTAEQYVARQSRSHYAFMARFIDGEAPSPVSSGGSVNYVLCKVDFQEIQRFLKDHCPNLPSIGTFLNSLRNLCNSPQYSFLSTVDVLDVLRTSNRAFAVNPKHPDYPKRGLVAYVVGAFRNKAKTNAGPGRQEMPAQPQAADPVKPNPPSHQVVDSDVLFAIGRLNHGEKIPGDILPIDRIESLVSNGCLAWDDQFLAPVDDTCYFASKDGRGITAYPRDYCERHGIKVAV